LVSQAVRSFTVNLLPYFANGLLRSKQDVIESFELLPNLSMLNPLAYFEGNVDGNIVELLRTSSTLDYTHKKALISKV